MRAVIVNLKEEELAERRSKGLDRWDEMWEGVYHMTPAPSFEHQRILSRMIEFLGPRLRQTGRGVVVAGVNVFRETRSAPDYRIPDLTFIATGREHVIHPDGIRRDGPDAVIEIRSPEDETYDKLPFYSALGVQEVIVCHRDTKAPEIFRLAGSQYLVVQRDPEGWLVADSLRVRMRRLDTTPPQLRIEDLDDPLCAVEI